MFKFDYKISWCLCICSCSRSHTIDARSVIMVWDSVVSQLLIRSWYTRGALMFVKTACNDLLSLRKLFNRVNTRCFMFIFKTLAWRDSLWQETIHQETSLPISPTLLSNANHQWWWSSIAYDNAQIKLASLVSSRSDIGHRDRFAIGLFKVWVSAATSCKQVKLVYWLCWKLTHTIESRVSGRLD